MSLVERERAEHRARTQPAELSRLEPGRRGPLVLLFYDGFEWKAAPGLIGGLHAQGRRLARYLWRNLKRKQVRTGFYTAFVALRRSLELAGCDVRVNDFAAAARRPDYPIGVAGYPSVIDKLDGLKNPRLFGPGDFGAPTACAPVAADPRFRLLTQPSDWFVDYYRPFCGDAPMIAWAAGIDTELWPDASSHPKDIDVLIYDKIRWNREERVPGVLERILRHLDQRGLSHQVLRYGHHHQGMFADGVRRARSMIFVCEHETQGLAYQEAMAANVPVLAWEEKEIMDPTLRKHARPGLDVSSVPYFDARCGGKFKAASFEADFDGFWSSLNSYRPREYVSEVLSMRRSAEAYLAAYASLAPTRQAS